MPLFARVFPLVAAGSLLTTSNIEAWVCGGCVEPDGARLPFVLVEKWGKHLKKLHVCLRVCVQVVQHNFVCNVAVMPESLPAADSSAAGCSLVLLVLVETENQQPLPWEAISSGVTLSLEVPDAAEAAAAAAGAAGSSKGRGGRTSKGIKGPKALVLTPECVFSAQEQIEGLGPAAAAAAAAAPAGCVVCFRTPQLTAAGCYTVAAEFRETREELLSGLKKEVSKSPLCAGPSVWT